MILKKLGDEYKLYSHDSCIATTYESPYKKLSLKNCQAIENGYDLNELADECMNNTINQETGSNVHKLSIALGFKKGFNKAMELNKDKLFSEEDMMLSWDAGVMSQAICTSNYFGLKRQEQLKQHRDSYKENLKPVSLQQNEWEVEIVCDKDCYSSDGRCDKSTMANCIICTPVTYLKDADGCLILKRK